MDRKECEEKILEKMIEIFNIAREYNPESSYISGFVSKTPKYDGIGDCLFVAFNNSYYDEGTVDAELPINYSQHLEFFDGAK